MIGKGSIHPRKCDISNTEDIEATFQWIEEKFGGIDILINNAGALHKGTIFGNLPYYLLFYRCNN